MINLGGFIKMDGKLVVANLNNINYVTEKDDNTRVIYFDDRNFVEVSDKMDDIVNVFIQANQQEIDQQHHCHCQGECAQPVVEEPTEEVAQPEVFG